ncbi:cytochrome p450 [Moniliophthora roreri]|nr:cytochrome p450 [Moniliophthora roreri]
MYDSILNILLTLSAIWFLHRLIGFWKDLKAARQYTPTTLSLLSPHALIGNISPIPIPYIAPGHNHLFVDKHRLYEECGSDVTQYVSLLPGETILSVADPTTAKEILLSRSRFPKNLYHYQKLTFFGRNIIASEGDEWKKYRKVVAPAFSDRNSTLVWNETVKVMNDLFDNVWDERGPVIELGHCLDITLPIALFVIGAAGFGRRLSWKEDASVPPNSSHSMTFKEALHDMTTGLLIKMFAPTWLKNVSGYVKSVDRAFDELDKYMTEMIQTRRASKETDGYGHDLFSSLLAANESDQGGPSLTNRELMGNVFIFLVAGHETTAHTLCFTFALLALYPEEQDILYEHIKSVLGDRRVPTYEEMPLFTQSMAYVVLPPYLSHYHRHINYPLSMTRVFYETLRLFPPVTGIVKDTPQDTTVSYNGQTIPIRTGTQVEVNITAVHYNPKYWPNPNEFKPSRFREDTWQKDAFLPFSLGPRACLGRKFFETEGIAILTMLMSRYRVELAPGVDKERLFDTRLGITLTPVNVPLVFTRRE